MTTPKAPLSLVEEVLANDTKHRYVGVDKGLIPLEDLRLKSWDYSSPTLEMKTQAEIHAESMGAEKAFQEMTLCKTDNFVRLFYHRYPELKGVNLNGLLVAGSAVGQFIRLQQGDPVWRASDVDIFLYGHASPEASQARLGCFIRDLDAQYHKNRQSKIYTMLVNESENAKAIIAAVQVPQQATSQFALRRGEEFLTAAKASSAQTRITTLLAVIKAFPTATFARAADSSEYCMVRPEIVSEQNWKDVAMMCRYQAAEVSVIRTEGSLTIRYRESDLKIQVIFRHYAHPSEVLHGFDMGPSAVGFDGTNVWFTGLGQFSYEYGVNLIDVSRRSPTFESRLLKYLGRKFTLVAPHLNTATLRDSKNLKYGISDVADLAQMPFSFSAVEGNRIRLERFVRHFSSDSDYGPDGDITEAWDERDYRVAYLNLQRLVRGQKNFVYIAQGYGFETVFQVLTKPPHLTIGMIQSLYDRFRSTVWKNRRLNIGVFNNYLPEVDVSLIVQRYANGVPMSETVNKFFDVQRTEAIRLWNTNIRDVDHTKIGWITENPGKQGLLTGSRTPIATTPAEWYGPLYYDAGTIASEKK